MRKIRYRWGFKFGKLEHKYRYAAYWLILIGTAIAGYSWYQLNDSFLIGLGIAIAILGIVFETVSLVAHLIEKRFMDKLRRQ